MSGTRISQDEQNKIDNEFLKENLCEVKTADEINATTEGASSETVVNSEKNDDDVNKDETVVTIMSDSDSEPDTKSEEESEEEKGFNPLDDLNALFDDNGKPDNNNIASHIAKEKAKLTQELMVLARLSNKLDEMMQLLILKIQLLEGIEGLNHDMKQKMQDDNAAETVTQPHKKDASDSNADENEKDNKENNDFNISFPPLSLFGSLFSPQKQAASKQSQNVPEVKNEVDEEKERDLDEATAFFGSFM